MANSIENTVTFSGSDIQVIAYRGSNTPAEKFEIDQTKRNIAQTESDIAQLKKERKIELDNAAAIEEELDAIKVRQLQSSGLENTPAGKAAEVEGKWQNQLDQDLLTLQREQANKEISDFKSSIGAAEEKLTGFKKKSTDLEGNQFFKLGTLHTLSYSSFREKFAVRTLGRVQAKDYTRGPRTIAGSLAFILMQEHELFKLAKIGEKSVTPKHPRAIMLDQIRPFNLLLLFANEYGAYSALHLLDVDLSSEGQEMSVDQVITHNTMNFYATDMLPMQNLGNLFGSYNEMVNGIITSAIKTNETSELSTNTEGSTVDAKIKNPFANDSTKITDMISRSRGLF